MKNQIYPRIIETLITETDVSEQICEHNHDI